MKYKNSKEAIYCWKQDAEKLASKITFSVNEIIQYLIVLNMRDGFSLTKNEVFIRCGRVRIGLGLGSTIGKLEVFMTVLLTIMLNHIASYAKP